jgi:hypothetical protein
MPEIVQLLASPVHRFQGRPVDGAAPAAPGELVDEVRIREGLGIVGDLVGAVRVGPVHATWEPVAGSAP